ncbi:MAG: putative membrane protein (DUF2157) [uncultured archaeon A07HR60]|nr:MAG: putative membrane protein (DUF2157) [uncultured archaeon A07HR60]
MDPDLDTLREHVDEWRETGIISEPTAEAILEYESTAESDGQSDPAGQQSASVRSSPSLTADRSRLVVALSLMGGLLVAAGIGLYVATRWQELPVIAQTALLGAVPLGGFLGGLGLARRGTVRVGHGLWFGAAVFTGVSATLLYDIYNPGFSLAWALGGWALVAISAGHAFPSQPTTAAGLGAGTLTVVTVTATLNTVSVVAVTAFGLAVFGAGVSRLNGGNPLANTYRLYGAGNLGLGLVVIASGADGLGGLNIGGISTGVFLLTGAITSVRFGVRRGWSNPPHTAWLGGTTAGIGIIGVLVFAGGEIPALVTLLAVHAVLLAILIGLLVVGVIAAERATINLVAALFLCQLFVFLLETVGETLPQSLALVVAGVILLAAGAGLERGRRELLAGLR